MAWWTLLFRLCLLAAAYVVFKRAAGVLVSLVASSRKVKVSVEAIGFLVIRGVTLTFAQGPIARVRLRELSFGRSASAKKAAAGVANAVSSFRPRIPLNCRGLELQLRVPPPAPPLQECDKPPRKVEPVQQRPAAPQKAATPVTGGTDGAGPPGPAAQAGKQWPALQRAHAGAAKVLRRLAAAMKWVAARLPPLPVHLPLRLAGSMALQLLLALLPSVPVRVKEIEIRFEELGIQLGIQRVVLLLHSSNMFSQLDATATVSAITAGIRDTMAASSAGKSAVVAPLLDIKGFSAAAALAVSWRAGGLRFLSLTSELGDLVATLTPALLEALLAFQPPPRQPRRPRPRRRPARPPRPPLAERLPGLLARAPQQAEFKAPLLALLAAGFAAGSAELELRWQARGLRLWSDTRPPAGRRRSVADGLRRASGFGTEVQLLQVMGSLGSVDARAGAVGLQAAVAAHCPGATMSVKLLQTPQGILTWRQTPMLTARASLDVGVVDAHARMANIWSAAAIGLQWHAAAARRRQQLLQTPPARAEMRQPSADLRAASAASGDLPLDAAAAAVVSGASAPVGSSAAAAEATAAPAPDATDDDGLAAELAEPPPQPARFLLDARANLNAASRFALLAPDGSPVATLSSSGVSLLATTEPLPGSASDRRAVAEDAVPEHAEPSGRQSASGRQSTGGSRQSIGGRQSMSGTGGHGRTASAAATPEALRASREVPPTPRSAAAWLRSGGSGGGGSKAGTPAGQPAATLRQQSISCRLDLGTLALCIASDADSGSNGGAEAGLATSPVASPPSAFASALPEVSDDPFASPLSTPAPVAQRQLPSRPLSPLLGIETVHVDLVAQPPAAAADTGSRPAVQLEGQILVSGIVTELNRTLVMGLGDLAAASLPDAHLLAAFQSIKAAAPPKPPQLRAEAQPKKATRSRKQPAVQLTSVGVSFEDWAIRYSTAPVPLPGTSGAPASDCMLYIQHRLGIGSIGAELLLPQKSVAVHLADLSVTQEETQQAATAAQARSSGGSSSAAAGVHSCRLLQVTSVSAGILPSGHSTLQPPGTAVEGAAGSSSSSSAATPAAAAAPAGPAIELDVSVVSVRFEPDVAFAAIDTAGELAAIAAELKRQLPAAPKPLPQQQQQQQEQASAAAAPPRAAAAAGASADMAAQKLSSGVKLRMAVRLRDLVAEAALVPDVCFAVRVGAVEHHVGTLAAQVSALAVQLNGQDVATVLQIRAAAEVLAASPAPAPIVPDVATADSAITARSPADADPGASSVRARSKRNSHSDGRPQLTIQLPIGSGSNGGGSGGNADAEQHQPQERPAAQLAMPFADDTAGLARARARAGVCTDGSNRVMSPAVIITAAVGGARVLLPHGCELGTAIRGTELWAKAFSQELKEHADSRLGSKRKAVGARPVKAAPAIELRLRLHDVAFVMQHHELESWLATHGRLLRNAATEQRLWLRALEAVPDDGVSAGRRLVLDRRVAADYRAACLSVDQGVGGDLMRAGLTDGELVLLVCGGGAAGEAAARQHIEAVDPPTVGVPLRQLLRLQLDVVAGGIAVHFCGNPQPLASAADLTATGVVGIGRQVTAPPATEPRAFDVGRHRHVTTQVTVKGCRSEVKVYTDLRVRVKGVSGAFGIGLQPTIGLVSAAGKRMGPSDPDKSRPKPEKLPWWDLMRFLWRGKLRAHVEDVDFALGTTIDPEVTATSRRLQVVVKQLDMLLGEGAFDCTIGGLAATAHAAADPVRQPGRLLALPFAEVGTLLVKAHFAWHLPGGRDPDDHHIFPIPAPEVSGVVQQPMALAAIAKSSGFDVALDIILGPPAPITGPLAGSSDESGAPVVFFGDYQMRFMQELIATFKSPPAFLKTTKKRGTFFARKPRSGLPPEPDVVKLLQGLDLSLQATPIDIMHWTADVNDPSCGVTVSIADVQYAHRLRLNQPLSPEAAARLPKSHPGTASQTLKVDVEGQQLRILLGSASPADAARLRRLQERTPSRTTSFGTPHSSVDMSLRSLHHSVSTDQPAAEPIAIISAFSVHQGSSNADLDTGVADNTVQAALQDCRFVFDLDSRNAMWGAALHLAAAVAPFKRPPFKKPGAQGPNAVEELPPGAERPPDGPAGLEHTARVGAVAGQARQQGDSTPEGSLAQGQQRVQASPAARPPPSPQRQGEGGDEADTGDELMRILMRQDRAEAAARGEASPAEGGSSELDRHSIAVDTSDVALHGPSDNEDDRQPLGSPPPADAQPAVRFRIQVSSLQVAAVDTAGGRFLLAAETAHVMGVDLPSSQRVTSLAVREVQAYISKPDAEGSPWLTAKDGELAPASDAIRRVFMPFSLQLRHTKSRRTSGQDLRLQAPEIHALLDSKEFLTFVDVVRHVMMPPPPEVAKLNEEAALLGEPEDESVAAGREAFALLHQEVASLAAEAHQVRSALPARWNKTASGGRDTSSNRIKQVEASVLELAEEADDVADLLTALRQHFEDLNDTATEAGSGQGGKRLLLQWLEQQSGGAGLALDSVRTTLKSAKTAARKRQLADHAAKVAVDVDAIKWSLCNERTPFFASALSGLKLAMTRNEDNSGSSKFLIHRIDIEEPAAPAAPGRWGQSPQPAADPKPIVSAWNPDESWDDDPAVRATAVLGVPTPERSVYDNLDLLVHPMAVSFTDEQLNALWEYFFPKEEEAAGGAGAGRGGGQELWMKSALSRTLKRGGGGSGGGGKGGRAPGAAAAAVAANPPLMEQSLAALSEGEGSAVEAAAAAAPSPGHRKSVSVGDAGSAVEGWAPSRSSTSKWALPRSWTRGSGSAPGATPKAPEEALAAFTPAAASRRGLVARTDSRMSSASGSTGADEGSRSRKRRQQSAPAARVALFRHVRFNRVHVSITYKGTYFSLNNAKMVLDNRVYDGLEGPWRDLFQRLKWDIVKSVLKSMTGLQGRKVKELLPAHLRSAVGKAERRVLQKSARAWLAARGGDGGGSSAAEEAPLDDAALQELRKVRLLLGRKHVERVTAAMAAEAAGAARDAAAAVAARAACGDGVTSSPSSAAAAALAGAVGG